MWIATKTGFISIVQHRESPDGVDLMLARARRHEDLAQSFPDRVDSIVEDPLADYRWRMNITRADFAAYLVASLEAVDYDSHVKEVLSTRPDGSRDGERYTAYLDVWQALYKLQEGGRWKVPTDVSRLDDFAFDPLDPAAEYDFEHEGTFCLCGERYEDHFETDAELNLDVPVPIVQAGNISCDHFELDDEPADDEALR